MRRYGQLDPDRFHATYGYDEGDVRTIFKASAGTVRIRESTPRRVAGSFRLTATLLYDCTLSPSLLGQRIMDCKPAREERSVEVTGSFDAGPLGGASPGLIPYDGSGPRGRAAHPGAACESCVRQMRSIMGRESAPAASVGEGNGPRELSGIPPGAPAVRLSGRYG